MAIQASVVGKFSRGKPFLNLNKRLRAQKEHRQVVVAWGTQARRLVLLTTRNVLLYRFFPSVLLRMLEKNDDNFYFSGVKTLSMQE